MSAAPPNVNPERDPVFRALVALIAIGMVAAFVFAGLTNRNKAAATSTTSPSASSSMGGMDTGSSTGSTGGSMGTMTADQMAAAHKKSTLAFPAKTAGLGGQPLSYTMDHGVKVFDLRAEDVRWEVSPGQFVDAMAYNGAVPGPQIRVNQGDSIRVVLHNEMKQPTVIHWHGVTVPNAMDGVPYITQDPVMPGESFAYAFPIVDPPGTYMYHSHFNSTDQVASGLYGSFVIVPKHATWDKEYTEFLNDGTIGYTINGKSFPATEPLTAKLGQSLLIRMENVGQFLHPFHLHGYHFTVMAQDGAPLQHPYSADTVVVAPGETYDLLVHAVYPGVWAFHCHILPHVEGPQGMFGMVTALIVAK